MSSGPRLPRRSALYAGVVGGAAGLVALAGCDDRGRLAAPDSSPSVDPDAALVDDVLADLAQAERLAEAAGLVEFSALNRAHIAALDGPEPTPNAARMRPEVALRREKRLQRELVAASLAAESGSLARLLASMSAAVSQRLAAGAS